MALETREHKLTLSEVLSTLVDDGMVAQADADALIAERRLSRNDAHPLVAVANQNWKSLLPPHKPLASRSADGVAGRPCRVGIFSH